MKVRSKVMALGSVAVVGLTALTGCGGGAAGQNAAGNATAAGGNLVTPDLIGSPNAKTTITWESIPAYSLKGSDPKRVQYLEDKFNDWAKQHPDWAVKPLVASATPNEAMAKLLQDAAAGNAPDVAQIDSYIFPQMYKYLTPLDEYLAKDGIDINDFFPFAQNIMKGPDGHVYGIYFTTDVRMLFYRKDLVPNPPKTWDELLKMAPDLEKKGVTPYLMAGGRGEASFMDILPMYWALGGKLVDDSGKPVFGEGQNKQDWLTVLGDLQQAVKQGAMPARATNYKNESDLNTEAASGKVAMFLGGNFQWAQLQSILGDMSNWGVAPLIMPKADTRETVSGGWVWGVFTKDPAKVEEAVSFIANAWGTQDGMAGWCKVGGYLPTRQSVYQKDSYFNQPPFNQFAEELKYSNTRPGVAIYSDMSNNMQIAVSSVISGSKTPEQALADAYNATLQQYNAMKK
jgi:multiple sugar transport system substrate-binding protein